MKKLTRAITLFFVSIVICLVASNLGICGNPIRGGAITVGVDVGPKGWDPHLSQSYDSMCHYEQIYESLVRYNNKMEIVPSLSVSWEQPDPLTYIFHLRKAVRFHNGREMTADDVKYSFERLMDPKRAVRPDLWKSIKTIEALDKYTVRFKLAYIDVGFLDLIAYNKTSAVVPREIVEKYGDLKSATCGTGPFKVKEYKPELYTIFERNKDYWAEGLPIVDELVFKVIKDDIARVASLRTGAVDIAWFTLLQNAEEATKTTKNLNIQLVEPSRQVKFYLQHSKFPGNNKKLRQAISSAIDRREMINTILFGKGEVSSCLPPCMKPYSISQGEVEKLPFYKRDLALSKKLMKEAGYPHGFDFEITLSNRSPDWGPAMEMVQANLKEVGINVKLVQKDWAVQLNEWRKGDFQGTITASLWYPTPESHTEPFFHSKSKSNYFSYANSEVDKLLEESSKTLDKKRRIEIWKKLQYIFAEDVALLILYASQGKYEVVHDKIQNYYFLPNTSRIYLREAWVNSKKASK